MRGGRSSAAQLAAVTAEAEAMGIKGASAMAAFARKADSLKNFGRKLTRRVTLPLLAAGAASFKMSADFDKSMNEMVGLVGISRGQVNAWKGDILDISKKTARAPKELADAMFFITSAGARGAMALDILDQAAMAGAAGLGETKTIADAVTSAVNAYGEENLSAAEATDIFVGAVRAGKLEASQLAPAIKSVAGISAEAGVGLDQTAGALAGMTRTMKSSAAVATAWEQILLTFMKPAAKTESTLEEVGLSAEKMRKAIAKDPLKALLMLKRRLKDAGIEVAEVVRQKRALSGFFALTGRNAKSNAEIMRDVARSQGLTASAFREAQESNRFQLDKTLNIFKVTAIRLGAALGPTVVPMIAALGKGVGGLADAFTKMPKPLRQVTGGLILFLAAIGPLAWMLGAVAAGVGKLLWLLTKMKYVVYAARLAWVALNLTFMATPLGLIIVGIVALVVGFYLLWTRVRWFRDAVKNVFEWIKGHWKWLILPLGLVAAPILLAIKHFKWLKNAAVNAFNWIKTAGGKVVNWLKGAWPSLSPVLTAPFEDAKKRVKWLVDKIKWLVDKIGWVASKIGKIPGLKGVIKGAGEGAEAVKGFFGLAQGGFVPSGFRGSFITGEHAPELQTITPQGITVQPLPAAATAGLRGGTREIVEHRWYIDGRDLTDSVGHQVRRRAARQ